VVEDHARKNTKSLNVVQVAELVNLSRIHSVPKGVVQEKGNKMGDLKTPEGTDKKLVPTCEEKKNMTGKSRRNE